MTEIVPAILSRSFSEVKEKIDQLEGLVDWVQLDIIDGDFAPNLTWAAAEDLKTIAGKIKIETHLMVERPEEVLGDWMAVSDRVLIHYESTARLAELIQKFEHSSVKLGLSLLAETPLEVLDAYMPPLSHVQLMGIAAVGFQGQPFVEETINRVATLRKKYPDATIEVDGGVSLENASRLAEAGATHLVVGGAIWRSGNVAEAINQFKSLV